jgi:hypothetical protein
MTASTVKTSRLKQFSTETTQKWNPAHQKKNFVVLIINILEAEFFVKKH